jgi:AcrR family transcriptional regulator
MPRRSKSDSRDAILQAALNVLCRGGVAGLTLEAVAESCACAKGLVLYHYGSKDALIRAAAVRLFADRAERWRSALSRATAGTVVDVTWSILTDESDSGVAGAVTSLAAHWADGAERLVSNAHAEFATLLASSVEGVFERDGSRLRVPGSAVGAYLAIVVAGIEAGLAASWGADALRQAYDVAWLSLLSLADPA